MFPSNFNSPSYLACYILFDTFHIVFLHSKDQIEVKYNMDREKGLQPFINLLF